MAQQYLFENASEERPAVYLSTVSEPLEKILRYGQTLSFFDPNAIGSRVFYEDLGTSLSHQDALTETLGRVVDVLRERRPGLLVIDSSPSSSSRPRGSVVLALDAADAVLALGADRPQLAIIDLLISGGAGLELCRDVHARGIPVLALSSVATRDAALEAGASAFLQKPLEPLQLVSAVKDLLGTSSFLNEVVPAR